MSEEVVRAEGLVLTGTIVSEIVAGDGEFDHLHRVARREGESLHDYIARNGGDYFNAIKHPDDVKEFLWEFSRRAYESQAAQARKAGEDVRDDILQLRGMDIALSWARRTYFLYTSDAPVDPANAGWKFVLDQLGPLLIELEERVTEERVDNPVHKAIHHKGRWPNRRVEPAQIEAASAPRRSKVAGALSRLLAAIGRD